jgi:hypothetical protein
MRVAAIAFLVLAIACTPGEPTATTPAPVTTQVTSATTVATIDPGLGCPQNADFVGNGQVLRVDQPESDAATVGLITWDTSQPGCEVFQIDFGTAEGAPATTPPSIEIEYLDSLQVLRIIVAADDTVIADQLIQTELVERLFTVRSLDGNMYVDLHLRQPTQARARISTSPARVFIELQPGPGEFLGQSTISDVAVLTDPWEGATVATNLEVTGYAMTAGDTVMIIGTNGGNVAVETSTETADSIGTWAEFKTRIDIPTGETSLFVGEQDEEEPGLAGVTVKVSTG